MTIQATSAAKVIESGGELSSHQLIALLMDGGLERALQAKESLSNGNAEEAELLLQKLVGIINGLRGSLDFSQGGEVATNLDVLYQYMLNRLEHDEGTAEIEALDEVGSLLTEVKSGWDEIG